MQTSWFYTATETTGDWNLNNSADVTPVPAVNPTITYSPYGMSLKVEGPQYAGFCANKAVPITALKSGTLTASMEVFVSPEALLANAWEFDHRITDGNGDVLPLDFNYVLADGKLEVVDASGAGWKDTGQKIPAQPTWIGQWIQIAKVCVFDWSKGTCAIQRVTIAGTSVEIDPSLGLSKPLPLKWGADICNTQVQPSCAGSPLIFTVRNVNVSATGSL